MHLCATVPCVPGVQGSTAPSLGERRCSLSPLPLSWEINGVALVSAQCMSLGSHSSEDAQEKVEKIQGDWALLSLRHLGVHGDASTV